MKIVIYTPFFYPSMGGLETVTDTLATELFSQGLDVEVYTPYPLKDSQELNRRYKITRSNSMGSLFVSVKNCDVFLHNSISLRAIMPLVFYRKKWLVVHHMILVNNNIKSKLISSLKKFVCRFATNIAVSKFMADYYGNKSRVIPNPIDLSLINLAPEPNVKSKDFAFMGRLIRDKGAHLAIESLSLIDNASTLTIIGAGPEEQSLKLLVAKKKLQSRVFFTGRLDANALYEEVKKHKVLLVPSVWTEPFGVVVLEGYACGCNIVASDIGGLPDAVGQCGILVKPNDIPALKSGMKRALKETINTQCVKKHLESHSSNIIANHFIELMKKES
jgi:glycosyltransferase involved in cell wall biosynthesis